MKSKRAKVTAERVAIKPGKGWASVYRNRVLATTVWPTKFMSMCGYKVVRVLVSSIPPTRRAKGGRSR